MKTLYAKEKDIKRAWYLIDASGKVLGRLATKIASLLIGKHKTDFARHLDMGDGVIIINSEKIKVTGKKAEQKIYKRFSGYPGGLHEENLETLLKRRPEQVLRNAVKGMMPKNKLGRKMIKRLKLCIGTENPYKAQKAKEIKV